MIQKNFSLVTLLILFCIILLNCKPVNSYNVTTYSENEAGLQVFNTLCYRDGTLTIYMAKPINESCIEPKLRVRTIYPNGTTEFHARTYSIPDFNFCRFRVMEYNVFTVRL